jgi:uncharacterized protein
MSTVTCYIYRCSAKADMYIYLAEEDNFNLIPDELKKNIGTTQLAMTLELNHDKKLAKEDASLVMDNLQEKGFHLQMPSDTPISEILEKIALNEQSKF